MSNSKPRYYVTYKNHAGKYFALSSMGSTETVPDYEACYEDPSTADGVLEYMKANNGYGYSEIKVRSRYPDATNDRRIIVNSEDKTKPATQVMLLEPYNDTYRLIAFFPDSTKALEAAEKQGLTKVMVVSVTDIKTYTRDGWKAL